MDSISYKQYQLLYNHLNMHYLSSAVALIFITILIRCSCDEWKEIYYISAIMPGGYHRFTTSGQKLLTITVEWQNSPSDYYDLDVFLMSNTSDLYNTFESLTYSFTQNNPQILSYEIQDEQNQFYVYVDLYYPYSGAKNYKIQVVADGSTILQQSGICITNNFDGSSVVDFISQKNCKMKIEYTGNATGGSIYFDSGFSISIQSDSQSAYFSTQPEISTQLRLYYPIEQMYDLDDRVNFTIKIFEYVAYSYKWYETFQTCFINCDQVQFAMSVSTNELTKCDCQKGYYYQIQTYSCKLQCGSIPYAIPNQGSNTECICKTGYTWNINKCLINCNIIQHSTGEILQEESIISCQCNSFYKWNQPSKSCIQQAVFNESNTKVIFFVLLGVFTLLILIIITYAIFKKKWNNRMLNQPQINEVKTESKKRLIKTFDTHDDEKETNKMHLQRMGRREQIQETFRPDSSSNRLQQNNGQLQEINNFEDDDSV